MAKLRALPAFPDVLVTYSACAVLHLHLQLALQCARPADHARAIPLYVITNGIHVLG